MDLEVFSTPQIEAYVLSFYLRYMATLSVFYFLKKSKFCVFRSELNYSQVLRQMMTISDLCNDPQSLSLLLIGQREAGKKSQDFPTVKNHSKLEKKPFIMKKMKFFCCNG